MSRHIIQAADGTRHIVEVPDAPGAASAPPTPQQSAPAPQETPGKLAGMPRQMLRSAVETYRALNSLRSGGEDMVGKTIRGVSQFAGGLSAKEKAAQAAMEQSQKDDPYPGIRSVGEFGANMVGLGGVGAAAQRGLQGAAAAPGVLSSVLAAMGASAGQEALTSVGEGETFKEQMLDKAKNAATAGIVSGGIQGLGRVAAMPFKPKPEAVKLFKQGVNPTLQQGADSKVGEFIGGLTSGSAHVDERQANEALHTLGTRISEGRIDTRGYANKDAAQALLNDLQAEDLKVYGNKRFQYSPRSLGEMQAAAGRLNPQGQFQKEAAEAASKIGNFVGPGEMNAVNRPIGYGRVKELRDKLTTLAFDDKNPPEVKERLLASLKVFDDRIRDAPLSADELTRSKQIDSLFFDAMRLKEATKGQGEKEGISILKLIKAYDGKTMEGNNTAEDLIGPLARVVGKNAQQEEARSALITARRIARGAGAVAAGGAAATVPGAALPLGALYGISALGQTAGGARALMGQTAKQQQLAELLRQGGAAPLGAAIVNQE